LRELLLAEEATSPRSQRRRAAGREKPKGPLMFQGNHGPVAYRNIKIAPLPQPVDYDVHDGYFVHNTFEPDQAESFVVLRDQAAFDRVFGVGMVMGDQAHRLPPANPFVTRQVIAAIKRGKALWAYEVKSVTLASGVLTVDYTATAQPDEQAEFACPLILSVPKGDYAAVRWLENGRIVRELGGNE